MREIVTRARLPEFVPLSMLRLFFSVGVWAVHFIVPAIHNRTMVAVLQIWGVAGMPFFFVLSGFLLGRHYAGRLGSAPALSRYTRNRIRRIAPLYFFGLTLAVVPIIVQAYGGTVRPGLPAAFWRELVPTLLGVQSWFFSGGSATLNAPAWSLSAELALYIAFPWTAEAMVRWKPARWLVPVMFGLALLVGLLLLAENPGRRAADDIGRTPYLHAPSFLLGVWMAIREPQTRTRLRRIALAWTGASILGAASFLIGNRILEADAAWTLLMTTGLVIPAGLLIAAYSITLPTTHQFARFYRLFGDLSYPIYILQAPTGEAIVLGFSLMGWTVTNQPLMYILLAGILVLATSITWNVLHQALGTSWPRTDKKPPGPQVP